MNIKQVCKMGIERERLGKVKGWSQKAQQVDIIQNNTYMSEFYNSIIFIPKNNK